MEKTPLSSTASILSEEQLPSEEPILPEEQLPSTAPILLEEQLPSTAPILQEAPLPSSIMSSVRDSIAKPDQLLWSLMYSKIQERNPLFEKIRNYAFPSITIDKTNLKSFLYDVFPSVFTSITLRTFCINIVNNYRQMDIYNMAGTYLQVLDIIHPGSNLAASYLERYKCVKYPPGYLFEEHSHSNVLIDDEIKFRTIIDTIAGENWDRIGSLYYEEKYIESKLANINYYLGLSKKELCNRRDINNYEVSMLPFDKNRNESLLNDTKVELNQLIMEKVRL